MGSSKKTPAAASTPLTDDDEAALSAFLETVHVDDMAYESWTKLHRDLDLVVPLYLSAESLERGGVKTITYSVVEPSHVDNSDVGSPFGLVDASAKKGRLGAASPLPTLQKERSGQRLYRQRRRVVVSWPAGARPGLCLEFHNRGDSDLDGRRGSLFVKVQLADNDDEASSSGGALG